VASDRPTGGFVCAQSSARDGGCGSGSGAPAVVVFFAFRRRRAR
jgi:hypothetical protein